MSRTLVLWWVLAGVLVAVPLLDPLTQNYASHDVARIAQICMLTISAFAAAVLLTTQWMQGLQLLPFGNRSGLLLAGALLAIAATSTAPSMRVAVMELAVFVSLIVFALVLASVFAEQRQLDTALSTIAAASGLLSFAVLVRYSASLVGDAAVLREHLIPGYSNYRFFNHVQCVTIPLLLGGCAVGGAGTSWRRALVALLSLEICWLLFTGGRATMIALAVGAIAVRLILGREATPWLRAAIWPCVFGGLTYVMLFGVFPAALGSQTDYGVVDTVQRSAEDTAGTRRYLWGLALHYIAESPWLGIGPMHFAHRVNVEAAHSHNIYLQIAAEWGLPMLCLLVFGAGCGLLRLVCATRVAKTGSMATLGVAGCAMCVAVAVDGMFSGNFVMPNSQLWIAFGVAYCIAFVSLSEQPSPAVGPDPARARAPRSWRVPALGFLVISQVALWQGLWPEILDVPAHVDRVRAEIVTNSRDNPRLWSHGWFK